MKNSDYPYPEKEKMSPLLKILATIAVIAFVGSFTIPTFRSEVNKTPEQIKPLDITVFAIKGSVCPDGIGKLIFEVPRRWGMKFAAFQDHHFDGNLNRVIYYGNSLQDLDRHVAEPNSPDWEIWKERYLEVKAEAGGKK